MLCPWEVCPILNKNERGIDWRVRGGGGENGTVGRKGKFRQDVKWINLNSKKDKIKSKNRGIKLTQRSLLRPKVVGSSRKREMNCNE